MTTGVKVPLSAISMERGNVIQQTTFAINQLGRKTNYMDFDMVVDIFMMLT